MPKTAKKMKQASPEPQKFVFLDTATADIAFEAYGKDENELFMNAALATESVMVDIKTVERKVKRVIQKSATKLDQLLLQFLEELVFLKDADSLVFSKLKVLVEKGQTGFRVEAELIGDFIDAKKQTLHSDIKAITYHMFKVEKTKNGWKATVLVDV